MYFEIIKGLLLPFLGTALGAACVLFIKKDLKANIKSAISGFAGGVMIAASIWSLIIPAMEYESVLKFGRLRFFPAVCGLWVGIIFMIVLERLVPEVDFLSKKSQSFGESKMLLFSVALHNLPEGMAVGVAYASFLSSKSPLALSGAFALSLGIAIQNFPEGAIISLPLASEGMSKPKAFLYGILSGIIEPIGAAITILALSFVLPILPFLLSFAAGAMIYAVIKELLPVIYLEKSSNLGVLFFSAGFSFMMILDVAFG